MTLYRAPSFLDVVKIYYLIMIFLHSFKRKTAVRSSLYAMNKILIVLSATPSFIVDSVSLGNCKYC